MADGQLATSPEAAQGSAPTSNPTPTQQAAPTQGGSILTSELPNVTPPPPEPGSADAALDAATGTPDWVVGKFWSPDKYKADPDGYLKEYAQQVSQGYVNAEKLIGGEKAPIPKDWDDPAQTEAFYKAAGRPDAPEAYEFKRPELPPTVPYDDDMEAGFREAAYASGLNARQANALYDRYVKLQMQRIAAEQDAGVKAIGDAQYALRREWGGQYDGNIQSAKHAIATYSDPDFLAYLDQSGLGNDPRMIRMFHRIGKEMGGDTKLRGAPAPEVAPADVRRAIDQFRKDNAEALYDSAHPRNKAATEELARLYERLPGQM